MGGRRFEGFGGGVSAAALGQVLLALALVTRTAWADGVEPFDATPDQLKSVEETYKAASKLFKAGKFEQALELLLDSHEIVADPRVSLMVARSYRAMGELLTARSEYLAALQEAETAARRDLHYKETLSAIQKDLRELDAVLGRLRIELIFAPEGTKLTVDNQDIAIASLKEPMVVTPHRITVVATTPEGKEVRRVVSIKAGEIESVKLAFLRDSEPGAFFAGETESEERQSKDKPTATGASSNTLAYVAGGIGIAGLAAFGVFGAMSKSKYDALESACRDDHCPENRAGDIEDGKRFQTFANIGLAVGVVGIGAGITLFAVGGSSSPEEKPKPTARVEVGPGSLHFSGRFE